MSGQIVNIGHENSISEAALRCGDELFQDFPKNIYSQAVYRAQRDVAKEYRILEREWTHTLTQEEYDDEVAIDITPLNFDYEIWVRVQSGSEEQSGTPVSREYKKVDQIVKDYYQVKEFQRLKEGWTDVWQYAIKYDANRYTLEYTDRSVGDIITMRYVSGIVGTTDYVDDGSNIIPIIPDKFNEEVITRAVRYIAKLGIARFDGEKSNKYTKVYRLNSNQKGRDDSLERNRAWIEITPFQYPGHSTIRYTSRDYRRYYGDSYA